MKIPQLTPFESRVMFVNLCGNTEIPKSFRFEYYTQLSERVVVSFDGTAYKNCTPIEGGVLAHLIKPRFNTGFVYVKRNMTVVSSNGAERQINDLCQLDCEIVDDLSQARKLSPTTKTHTDYNGFQINETVEIDIKSFTYDDLSEEQKEELRQGCIGINDQDRVKTLAGYDLSPIDTEIECKGEFWIDQYGVKKQVYAITKRGNLPNAGQNQTLLTNVSAFQVVVAWCRLVDGVLLPDRMMDYIMATQTISAHYYFSLTTYGNTLRINCTGGEVAGKEYLVAVKYTK